MGIWVGIQQFGINVTVLAITITVFHIVIFTSYRLCVRCNGYSLLRSVAR